VPVLRPQLAMQTAVRRGDCASAAARRNRIFHRMTQAVRVTVQQETCVDERIRLLIKKCESSDRSMSLKLVRRNNAESSSSVRNSIDPARLAALDHPLQCFCWLEHRSPRRHGTFAQEALMTHQFRSLFVPLALGALCMPALAQTSAEGLSVTANNAQSPKQQATDRYECHSWAAGQSGFDSTLPGGGVAAGEYASRRAEYQRAMTACLEARGYSVIVVAPVAQPVPPSAPALPPAASPVLPPASPRYAVPVTAAAAVPAGPELKYHPLQVQIEGGYSLTAGSTSPNLDDGPNVGLGLTWTPTSALPVAVRVDGSYSWFDDRDQLLNLDGGGYTSGHEDIYGGDVDLQLDLAHRSSRSKLYLFGGAGWYREATELRRVSLVNGLVCGYWFCGPGVFPAVTADERSTSNWHQSWNAGIGWETAIADGAAFFIEARYLRIEPIDSKMQFVPIRAGLRF
jgi:hypothetical protein